MGKIQQQLVPGTDLLDEQGHVRQIGYGTDFVVRYNREQIQRPQSQILEWDYYLALKRDYAIGVSTACTGAQSRISVHLIDFKRNFHICETDFIPESIPMPLDPFGDVSIKSGRSEGTYVKKGSKTYLKIHMNDFGGDGIHFDALLEFTIPKTDKMVIVVPYEDPELFYYNYKVNCLAVTGFAKYGDEMYEFSPEDCVGTNDWGRGLWEPVNQWYWGSASGEIDGLPFGFNIGHGFGDTAKATENMIFYDGVCHKLNDVTFHIPGDVIGDLKLILPDENYLQTWDFVSSDGRLDMKFTPVHDRQSGIQRAEYLSVQHQVFGYFNGTAVLDDGRVLEIRDLFGFAEKVGNDWR